MTGIENEYRYPCGTLSCLDRHEYWMCNDQVQLQTSVQSNDLKPVKQYYTYFFKNDFVAAKRNATQVREKTTFLPAGRKAWRGCDSTHRMVIQTTTFTKRYRWVDHVVFKWHIVINLNNVVNRWVVWIIMVKWHSCLNMNSIQTSIK